MNNRDKIIKTHNIEKKSTPKALLVCALILSSGVMITLDQLLKIWSSSNLANQPPRVLINGILGLTYFHNTGAAFGFLGGQAWGRWVLTVVVILLLVTVVWYYFRLPATRKMWLIRVPLLFVFAGGMGNLIDRVRLGYVVDMLEFLFIRFAVFNLADVFIVSGIIAVPIIILIMGKKDAPWPFREDVNTGDKQDDMKHAE